MVQFLPSALGIATGDAPAVGIHYVAATEKNPPLRIYYPAEQETTQTVGYFDDTSACYFLQGYWSVLMARKRDTRLYKIGLWILRFVTWFLPLKYLHVPNVYRDAPVYTNKKQPQQPPPQPLPLILFSHGLTGTGQENSVLLSSWAQQGHVVLSVHHTDGSSNRVRLANGEDLWYDPGPPHSHYDATFRPRQMEDRVQQLLQAREWLVGHHHQNKDKPVEANWSCCTMIDWEKTIVAGFSYGAATACLLAAKQVLPSLQAVILLDGWFHIDMRQSAGIEFEFPQEAYRATHLKEIPALLINSEQFTKYSRLWAATQKMATQFATDPHQPINVLPKTKHNNFVDLVFWFPSRFLKRLGTIGEADARQTYVDLVRLTNDFLKAQQRDPWKTEPEEVDLDPSNNGEEE